MPRLAVLFFALLACASAWMVATRPSFVEATQQCAAPAMKFSPNPTMKFSPKMSLDVEDSDLDNPLIAADDSIVPARKCASCFG